MTKLEFITANRVSKIPKSELYDFIISRIMDNKILIIEEMFDPLEKMQLIRRGFETTSDKNYYGMKILQIKIKSETSGFLRNKQKTHQFNLIAPGSSTIEQEEDGHYSVIMEEGDILSAVI